MGGTGDEDDLRDVRPWERQPSEPPRLFAIFSEYIRTNPRSIREALRRVWKIDGREATGALVPGHIWRASERWRWRARAEAFDLHRAQEEHASFTEARRAARKKRRARLQKLGTLFDARLSQMGPKDIKRLAPRHFVQELARIHGLEREELGEAPTEKSRPPDSGLPSIDERIPPTEE